MKPPTTKASTNRSTRGANGGANASTSTEDAEPGSPREEDTLTAGMFAKALDSLRNDICTKIETAVSEIQTDIAAVRVELTSSIASIQRVMDEHDGRLKEVELSATS